MTHFRTSAILIRRTEYGDSDLIVTFFTLSRGKLSLIAKAAKKARAALPAFWSCFRK